MSEKKSWWSRLKGGLKKTSDKLEDGLKNVFVRKRLDQETLDELEELLIMSDMGVEAASSLTQALSKEKMDKDITLEEVKIFLANKLTDIIDPYARELEISTDHAPHVILVVGVNGSGKTTTIGKLAKQWRDAGHTVRLVAGDTFRAAAVEQLQVWASRTGVPITVGKENCDAAGLAYEALQQAQAEKCDILIIDTAGRLHNKAGLMDELKKLNRVIQKLAPSAPHSVLLVLDATTGQNAQAQVQVFKEMAGVTGLIITKLDGTAKGGVVVSLCDKFKLPVHAIGIGESVDDLHPFTAHDFARTLVGIDAKK